MKSAITTREAAKTEAAKAEAAKAEEAEVTFDLSRYESDKEAAMALRQVAATANLIREFLKGVPGDIFALAATAEALSPLVTKSKREDLRNTATAALRYVK